MQIKRKMLYTSTETFHREKAMAETIKDIRGQKIRELVEEMKLYNNPQELEDMKKIIKKNVPMMMRGYLLAYLYVTRGGNTAAKTAKPAKAQPRSTNSGTCSGSKARLSLSSHTIFPTGFISC